MRWQDMKDGKEKYAAYLCSREWSVLKEAVRERSGGVCERCTVTEMDHVHHLTYARKYRERLEDLQACCKQCHEFIHGKSEFDPACARFVVIPWCKSKVKSFYLAGKITGTSWRDEIVPGWSEAQSSAYANGIEDDLWLDVCSGATACGISLDYCGPWWMDVDGGHGVASSNVGPHAYGDPNANLSSDYAQRQFAEDRKSVSFNVHRAISSADMVFAWIDSLDCYGTIFEIGLARAHKKVVVIGFDKAFEQQASEMWLAFEGCYCVSGACAREAWDQFWDLVAFEDDPALGIGVPPNNPLAEALADSAKQAGDIDGGDLLEALVSVLRLTRRGTIPLCKAVFATRKEAMDGPHA